MVTTLAGAGAANTVCEPAMIRSVNPILIKVVNRNLGAKIIRFMGKPAFEVEVNVRVARRAIFQGGVSKQKQKVSMVEINTIDHGNFTNVFS